MEDDGTIAPGKFYADYPLWTLYSEELDKKFGMPGGVPQVNPPEMKPLLAVFTDQELAQRFIDKVGWPGVVPLALPNPEAVLKVAEHFLGKGVEDVGIDISFHAVLTFQLHPITEFIEDVRRGAS